MIKSQELRIGNLVNSNAGISVVKEIYQESVLVAGEDYEDTFALKYIEPVVLTEEWLLKAGFEIFSFGYRISGLSGHFDYYIQVSDPEDMQWQFDRGAQIESTHPTWDYIVGVYHIHQLQNIYFALTGEELTLTVSK